LHQGNTSGRKPLKQTFSLLHLWGQSNHTQAPENLISKSLCGYTHTTKHAKTPAHDQKKDDNAEILRKPKK